MRKFLVISLALLFVTLSAASIAGAREIEKVDFRIKFQFRSDGGWSDQDGWTPTSCGAVAFDNVSLTGDVSFSEDFEGVIPGSLPPG